MANYVASQSNPRQLKGGPVPKEQVPELPQGKATIEDPNLDSLAMELASSDQEISQAEMPSQTIDDNLATELAMSTQFQPEQTASPEVQVLDSGEGAGGYLRAALDYAKTEKQQESILRNAYGEGNYLKKDGQWAFRRSSDLPFERVDPKGFDSGDILADNARVLLELGVQLPFEAMALAGVVGSGGAAIPVLGAVGAASSVASSKIADLVGEKFFGIKEDPNRTDLERLGEDGFNAAVGAVANMVIPGMSVIAKKLIGAESAATVAKSLKSHSKELNEVLPESLKNGVDAMNSLKQWGFETTYTLPSGKKAGVPIELMINENTGNEALNQLAKEAATLPETKEVAQSTARSAMDAMDWIMRKVSSTGGMKAESVYKGTQEAIESAYNKSKSAVGEQIGNIRNTFKNEFQGATLEASDSMAIIKEIDNKLFLNQPTSEAVNRSAANSIGSKLDPDQVGMARDKFFSIYKDLQNNKGSLSANQYEYHIAQLEGWLKGSLPKSEPALMTFGTKLVRSLRDDYANGIVKKLDGKPGADTYIKTLKEYSTLMKAGDQLANLLEGNPITRKGLVREIFSNQKEVLSNLQRLYEFSHISGQPQVWKDVLGEAFDTLIETAKKGGSDVDPLTYAKEFQKMFGSDPRVLEWILKNEPSLAPSNVRGVVKFINDLQTKRINLKDMPTVQRTAKGLAQAFLTPFWYTRANGIKTLVGSIVKRKELLEMVSKGGLDDFLASVPESQRADVKFQFEKMLNYYKVKENMGKKSRIVDVGLPIVQREMDRQESR